MAVFSLYDGARPLPRARGQGFSLVKEPSREITDNQTLAFPEGALRNWRGLAEADLHLIPGRIRISNILPIAEVDEEAGIARTAVPCTYPMRWPWKMAYKTTAWVENVIALLDEPGEWVLNSETNKLYLWPRDREPGDQIVAPLIIDR